MSCGGRTVCKRPNARYRAAQPCASSEGAADPRRLVALAFAAARFSATRKRTICATSSRGSRSASAWATLDLPEAIFPVIRMICPWRGGDVCTLIGERIAERWRASCALRSLSWVEQLLVVVAERWEPRLAQVQRCVSEQHCSARSKREAQQQAESRRSATEATSGVSYTPCGVCVRNSYTVFARCCFTAAARTEAAQRGALREDTAQLDAELRGGKWIRFASRSRTSGGWVGPRARQLRP